MIMLLNTLFYQLGPKIWQLFLKTLDRELLFKCKVDGCQTQDVPYVIYVSERVSDPMQVYISSRFPLILGRT